MEIKCPITIASDFDGPAADGSSYRKKFSGKYSQQILKGIGHNVPQEAPQSFAKAVAEVDGVSLRRPCGVTYTVRRVSVVTMGWFPSRISGVIFPDLNRP